MTLGSCPSSAEGFSKCWTFSASLFCTCQRFLFRLIFWDQVLAVAVTPVSQLAAGWLGNAQNHLVPWGFRREA